MTLPLASKSCHVQSMMALHMQLSHLSWLSDIVPGADQSGGLSSGASEAGSAGCCAEELAGGGHRPGCAAKAPFGGLLPLYL